MKKSIFVVLTLVLIGIHSQAQNFDYVLTLEPISINGVGGIQSFAFGQDDGKWVIIGGRLDGLHRRQPWASFDVAGHNDMIYVIDPDNATVQSESLNILSVSLKEQLSSTNMQFYQDGDFLYLTGGYGYSATAGDHVTYDNLVAVDVPALINAIENNQSINPHFRQVSDPVFAVTGGQLFKVYDTYYLVGGQKFMGLYNPHGPTHGPGFFQEYTNQIRKFRIQDDGVSLSISDIELITDSVNLHRRDLNVLPQIFPYGEQGLTAFSGVFRQDADLPFLNAVNIDTNGFQVDPSFLQYYNHYHCATISMYSDVENVMHNLFFGGIAQFYDSSGVLVQDDEVPFVRTIARVSRDAAGVMSEHKLGVEMPAYLGAGAEFIPNHELETYMNGVVIQDSLKEDSILLGFIYGGINSSMKNIFWINTGTESFASDVLFKVILVKDDNVGIDNVVGENASSIRLEIEPNPNNGEFQLFFELVKRTDVDILIYDNSGRVVKSIEMADMAAGKYSLPVELGQFASQVYIIDLVTSYERVNKKVVIRQ